MLFPCTHYSHLSSTHALYTEPFASFSFHPYHNSFSLFVTNSHPLLLLSYSILYPLYLIPFLSIYTRLKKQTVLLLLTHRVVRMKSYLPITSDMNLLMAIPRVYQMMSLLEGNTTMRDKSVDTLPKNGPFLHSGYTYPLPLSTPTPSPQNQC